MAYCFNPSGVNAGGHGTGFGDCNDVTAADGPRERNSGCRANVRCANTCERGIPQQTGAKAEFVGIHADRTGLLHERLVARDCRQVSIGSLSSV